MKKKNLAFTLAEVLIVIGIIGVVAALTLPNLNHATGDKERITKVKKIYSALNDAYDRAQVVYGDANRWQDYAFSQSDDPDSDTSDKLFLNRIAEFMKISKANNTYYGRNIVTLPDGLEFLVRDTSFLGASSAYYPGQNILGVIDFDIDGFEKGKNIDGIDRFAFHITDQGIYPEGISDDNGCFYNAADCGASGHYGATRWILENDNADYLKADDTGKCKDSDIILNWTTNTSCH